MKQTQIEYEEIRDLLHRQLGMGNDFESQAQRYAKEHGVTLDRAYREIAKEHPALWEAHREAAYLE